MPLRHKVRWATEVTVHDTLQMKEHLPLLCKSGCRALWLGVEDMTATLVNKGQSVNKTTEAFQLMRDRGHLSDADDDAPRLAAAVFEGNELRLAQSDPPAAQSRRRVAPGSDDDSVRPARSLYEETFNSGQVLAAAGGRPVAAYMHDGNYVVASSHRRPWQKQLNMIIGYLYFYNPVWFATNLLHCKTKVRLKPAGMQIVGMIGLLHTIRRTFGWTLRLAFRKIERLTRRPHSNIPMHSIDGGTAAHEGGKPIPMPIPAAAQGRRVSLVVAG